MLVPNHNALETLARLGLRVLLCAMAANVVFYCFIALMQQFPTEPIRLRIVSAFEAGDLASTDFAYNDSLRGSDQFSDAYLMSQLLCRTRPGILGVFSHPYIREFYDGWTTNGMCNMLRRLVSSPVKMPVTDGFDYYHRYWEGAIPVSTLLLHYAELYQVRLILKSATYFALGLLTFAVARAGGRMALFFGPVLVYAFFFSEIPYLGQSLTHMGFQVAIFVIAALVLMKRRLVAHRAMVTAAALAGAAILFFDNLNGPLLMGACLILPALYFIKRDRQSAAAPNLQNPANRAERFIEHPLGFAFTGFAAYVGGFGCSYLLKLLASSAVFGVQAVFGSTAQGLGQWVGGGVPQAEILEALLARVNLMTYGSQRLAEALLWGAALSWVVAAALLAVSLLSNRNLKTNLFAQHFLICLLSALGVIIWYPLLNRHSHDHAWFMVRFCYIPFSVGWSAILLFFFDRADPNTASEKG